MRRRSFLEVSSLFAAAHLSEARGLPRETVQGDPRKTAGAVPREYWNDYPDHLAAAVNSARARRKAILSNIKDGHKAGERISFIRSTVWDLIGGQLEKAPLNIKAVGTIQRKGYRIEKLIFESQPQFYVPAHLYVPESGNGPFPGIISPLGHTSNGKAYRSYQILFQNLARKGCVVFTWDPPGQGERVQFLVPGTTRSRFGPTGEHDQFGFPALLLGSTATQFEVWDAVRALDYLLTRSEVDASRIGCCGHSGGGTQTMYLCALEPRINAAIVVEGHTENVGGANYEPPGAFADAEQNIIGSLKHGLDRGDLLAAFAPKPLLICYTHMDNGTTYSPHYEQGTREIFHELRDFYSTYGASDKVGLSASNFPHDYDFFHRRATYNWFNKWLKDDKGEGVEAEFDAAPESALFCTSTGQILTSLGGRTAIQVNWDQFRSLQSRWRSNGEQIEKLPELLREVLALPRQTQTGQSTVLSKSNTSSLSVEEFEVYSAPTIRVPGWFIKPAAATSKLPVVLLLSSSGKNRLFADLALLNDVTRNNVAFCAIDTRASGEATPRFPSSGPLFYSRSVPMAYSLVSLTAGMPLIGQRVGDVLCSIEYLTTRDDVDLSRIGLFGSGSSGLQALFGAALDARVRSVLLDSTLTDFASLVASDDCDLKVDSMAFGFLRHFDLPEICSALAPKHLWILNPAGPDGAPLPLSVARTRYANTIKTYESLQNAARFSLTVELDGMAQTLAEWVKFALV